MRLTDAKPPDRRRKGLIDDDLRLGSLRADGDPLPALPPLPAAASASATPVASAAPAAKGSALRQIEEVVRAEAAAGSDSDARPSAAAADAGADGFVVPEGGPVGNIVPDGGLRRGFAGRRRFAAGIEPRPLSRSRGHQEAAGHHRRHHAQAQSRGQHRGLLAGDQPDHRLFLLARQYARAGGQAVSRHRRVFDAGFDQYDSKLVYTDLYEAQAFYDTGDSVTGVEMKVADIENARDVAREIDRRLATAFTTRSIGRS